MQPKVNFLSDNHDLEFHLQRRLRIADLFAWLSDEEREAAGASTPEEYLATVTEGLSGLGEICGTQLAPNAQKVEQEPLRLKDGEVVFPPTLKANMDMLVEFGCPSFGVSPRYEGLGFGLLFELVGSEMIARACPSTGLNISWYSSIAHIIDMFGTQALKDEYIPRLASGEWSGCMALTEPDAGSDLGALRSYGERQPDGTWQITGTKRFISNGSGQVALVLAMNKKGASGLENLNLYLCPRKLDGADNFCVTKLEEKIALHGSATCELAFDASRAYLVGEENKGFQHMLVLMNDARIATAFQALGMMEGAYRLAKDYAQQRKTWGKPIAHHELILEKLLDIEVDIMALRSLSFQAAYHQTMAQLGERRLKDETLSEAERLDTTLRVARFRRRMRRWTPLIKWYGGEKAFEVARNAMQIHGGYGFTTEYRAEWWVRESLILSLYEGTSQIQALMCLKDTMKEVLKAPRRFIEKSLGYKLKVLRETDPLTKKLYHLKQLLNGAITAILIKLMRTNAKATLAEVKPSELLGLVKRLKAELTKMNDLSAAIINAERLCEMKALTAMAESLVADAKFDESRRWAAQRFMARALPRMTALKMEIEADEPVVAERLRQVRGHEGPGHDPSEYSAAGTAAH